MENLEEEDLAGLLAENGVPKSDIVIALLQKVFDSIDAMLLLSFF